MKIANTKRIRERIMELQTVRPHFNALSAVVTNQIATSTIEPTIVQELAKQASKLKEDLKDDVFKNYSVEKLVLLLYIESLTDIA